MTREEAVLWLEESYRLNLEMRASFVLALEARVARECAEIAGGIAGKAWAKHMTSTDLERGGHYTEGFADGAELAETTIRERFGVKE